MNIDADSVGETVASEITDAIETANEQTANAEAVAAELAQAAIEGERGRRLDNMERDLGECLSNQASLSEALTGMALRLEELAGAQSTLAALLPSAISQTAESQNAVAAGQQESPEAEAAAVTVVAPEAETVEVPAVETPKPERKRKRWI